MTYFNSWQLINAHANEPDKFNENCFLYTVEYWLLLLERGFSVEAKKIEMSLRAHLIRMKNDKGLYDNIPSDTPLVNPEDAYTSRDQLIAYSVVSKILGLDVHKEIFRDIKRLWYSYNNLTGKFSLKRIVSPIDYVFFAMLNGDYRYKHLLFISGMHTFSKPATHTSGKLLWFVRLSVIAPNWYTEFYEDKIRETHGFWGGVFTKYFPDPDHPIRKILHSPPAFIPTQ